MIYLNNEGNDYITDNNFVDCGNSQRDELSKVYHLPDGRELFNFLDGLDSWADVPADVFQQLAEVCGVEYDAQEEADDLMERCEKALSKEEAAEEVKWELKRRLASREKIKEEIEINQYDLEKLFRRLKDGEDVVNLIQSFVAQKEGLYKSLCDETYKIATLNAVQVLGVEEEYKKAAEETEDWMKPENYFPNLNNEE
jgi:hypothetical protein